MKLSHTWLAASLALATPLGASAAALVTDSVFASTSFWYTPIPANATLHPNSANFAKEILRQKAKYYNTVTVNTRDYTSPVYTAGSSVAKVKVTQWDCQKKGYSDPVLAEQWASVPIPSYALPSKGTDAEMTIYQPSTDTVWEFWQARKVNGQWQACWGGRMQNASQSNGVHYKYYGTTATSLPFLGGQVTAEELRRGEIKHAIGFSLVEAEHYNIFSWPANRSDGYNPLKSANRIAEGMRFRLDPTINVDALPMSRTGKIIAKAAQKYGFVVWDKSGALAIRAQNAVSYTALGQADPYPSLFEGRPNYAVLNGFPWEKLQFMPMHYGKTAISTAGTLTTVPSTSTSTTTTTSGTSTPTTSTAPSTTTTPTTSTSPTTTTSPTTSTSTSPTSSMSGSTTPSTTTSPTTTSPTTTSPTTTTSGSGLLTDAVFAANSFWYTPIPANAPLHPNSANYAKDIVRQKNLYYKTVNINTGEYSSPVYIAASNTATVKVTEWDCQKKGFLDKNLLPQWEAVPIPSYAVPSKGTDAEMTIYQPSTNTVWEFWQMRKVNGQWQACWGGRMQNAKSNVGVFPNRYGTTATSLPFLGGQITAEELQRGEIRHAIGFSLVEAEHFTNFSWPASRSDGWNPYKVANRIPEGMRFRLDPRVNVDALPMTRTGKIIAKAAQKYGFIVWDKSGALAIRAQNVVSYTAVGKPNPYPTLFEGKQNYEVLNGFPWDKLQFLPMHYGKQ